MLDKVEANQFNYTNFFNYLVSKNKKHKFVTMAIPSKQIGWSNESNLLWQISSQMERLTGVVSSSGGGGGNSTYKVYSALLTQRDIGNQYSGPLVIGTSYIIYRPVTGDDFTNVGFVEVNVPFIATGTTPTNWTNGTEVYDYELSKPTVVVLENTLGDINFEFVYTDNGLNGSEYGISVESNNLFIANKTFITCGIGIPAGNDNTSDLMTGVPIFIAPEFTQPQYFTLFSMYTNELDSLYDFVDMPIEIRVYN